MGIASARASQLGLTPRAYGETHIHELQQLLLKNDCYLIGVRKDIRQKLQKGDGDPIHVVIEAGE